MQRYHPYNKLLRINLKQSMKQLKLNNMIKSIIRLGLFTIALICFSNMAIAQKKNKKKAKTTISSKKKKQSSKKTSSKKKKPIQKRPTLSTYIIPESIIAKTIDQLVPITKLPLRNYLIDSIPEKVVTIISAFKPQLKNDEKELSKGKLLLRLG